MITANDLKNFDRYLEEAQAVCSRHPEEKNFIISLREKIAQELDAIEFTTKKEEEDEH